MVLTKAKYWFAAAIALSLAAVGVGNWVSVRSVRASEDAPRLVGSFRATAIVPNAPFPPVTALFTYNSDGTLTGASNVGSLFQILFPGSSVTPAHGVWARTGPSTYATTFLAVISNGPPSSCFVRNKEVVALQPNGNNYTGTFAVDLLDCSGTSLGPVGGGTISGTRITM